MSEAAVPADEALARLRAGNARFADGIRSAAGGIAHSHRTELARGQSPFAVILGCSDSRVPAEIVFDQGLGDLFVVRVAGNIAGRSQVGSVEFAVSQLGCRLVVVLGHSQCGAVLATLDELRRPSVDQSPNLRAIVDRVRPSVEGLLVQELDEDERVRRAVRANVAAAVKELRHGSPTLESLVSVGLLEVVGAEYSLATGRVEFFDRAGTS